MGTRRSGDRRRRRDLLLRSPLVGSPAPAAAASTIGGPFTLVGADGKPFSSAKLAGKPYAIYFGFTRCGDVCPTTLVRLVKLRGSGRRGQVQHRLRDHRPGQRRAQRGRPICRAVQFADHRPDRLAGADRPGQEAVRDFRASPRRTRWRARRWSIARSSCCSTATGSSSRRSHPTSRTPSALAKLKRPELERCLTWPNDLPARSENPGARARLLRCGRAGALSQVHAALPQSTAGPSASGSNSTTSNGPRISAASSRCPTTSRSRWRCAITATSSGCTIPTSATAAASCSRSFATTGGRLLDLGTKGSGQTPYSRFGDGRLTLKGGVREVLATEMLEALGVNTSKTFALFETGEALERGDEPSPTRSAVLTRLSHGHIRIGTFQRLAFLGEADNISKLVRYCLEQSLRRAAGADDAEMRCACSTWSAPRPRGSPPPTSPPASSTACSTATISRHRRELRLRPVALHARLGPGVHRRLFRPLRPLCLRPPARGDPLGPRPARRLPVADRRAPSR